MPTIPVVVRALPFLRRAPGVRRLTVLSELQVGESGILIGLDLPESVQNHLMHMGFVPDAHVTALRRAPAGDPTVYAIDGMEIALRVETAKAIRVRNADGAHAAHAIDARYPETRPQARPEAPLEARPEARKVAGTLR
jgi:ferrous iron transport protein A